MALAIAFNVNRHAVHRVGRARVVQEARKTGNPNANDALAVTAPRINRDFSKLQFLERRALTGYEFIFQTGTMVLTLSQDVFIDHTLSNCAQGKWLDHELGHVRDNANLTRGMEPSVRALPELQGMVLNPAWHPRARFQALQQRMAQAIADEFFRLTAQAVAGRDTSAEYRRVRRQILTGCPEPYLHTVERGDTLSRLALYFYGRAAAWPTIHAANQTVIGANPDHITVGQQLRIPPKP